VCSGGNRLKIDDLYCLRFGLFDFVGHILDEFLLDYIIHLTWQHVVELCSRLYCFEVEWIKESVDYVPVYDIFG